MRYFSTTIVAAMLFLTGCQTFEPNQDNPQKIILSINIPQTYSKDALGEISVPSTQKWWLPLNSDELNTLIERALAHNFDLKNIQAKLAQTRAVLEKEKASFLPNLDYSFGGQRKRTQVKSTHDGGHSWDASLSGSWKADVWGDQHASQTSKKSDLKAVEKDLAYAKMELASQVAEVWIDIIASRSKKKILVKQVNVNTTLLDLQKLRYTNGKANALDVSQQREALADVRSQGPLLDRQEFILMNTLAFLSGKTSVKNINVKADRFPDTLPLPALGIPSNLLENRPDITAAKDRLLSSQWEVTIARADLLPSLTLTARALFSSGQLDLIFQNWIATLTASIAGPIFDGGSRKAEVARVKAVAQELSNKYAQTVAQAIREVENQLINIETQDRFIRLLDEELRLARLTLKDAQLQYRNGQSSYLSFLIALTRIEQLGRQLEGERATAFKERFRLYRALGFQSTGISNTDDYAE